MTYCPACCTPRECDAQGCARRETAAPSDLFGDCSVRYLVTGKGAFPVDMLRTDRAWPANAAASARIVNSFGNHEGVQTVSLRGMSAPNFRAWLAASWTVTEINGVHL